MWLRKIVSNTLHTPDQARKFIYLRDFKTLKPNESIGFFNFNNSQIIFISRKNSLLLQYKNKING